MSADALLARPAAQRDASDASAARGAGVTWLVDNADAYRALLAECRGARESIWITQLAFDADCVAREAGDAARETRIVDLLLVAAGERGVDVRILLNASLLLDTAAPLRAYAAAAGADPARFRIRGIRRFPQLLHAKLVVVDRRAAFLMGSPFVNGYLDDSQHAPTDARRPPRELGGRPLHDLSVQLEGAAAAALGEAFAELWNGADDVADRDVDALPAPPTSGAEEMPRIVRSAPRARRAGHPPERAEILPALLEGIAGATRLIYVEHQYLSSLAVIGALAGALERAPRLEIIVVLNQNPDVTAYRGWQNRRLASSGLFSHPRVGTFALWSVAPRAEGRAAINQLFVHSKVVVVDDRWAMVGSANLDGVSLQTYGDDFSSRLGRRVFRGVRNFDVAAVLAGEPGSATAASVLELRTALWREHLDAPDLDASAPPAEGWLAHWRRRAAEHARELREGRTGDAARIVVLPYSRRGSPARQLGDAGVALASQRLDLCFDPSWVEVHLSPNWVRNMFA